ncbi:tripartite tricarboxylate transporter substrate binding protein [Vineibacter terrae]|uniref:tripartite tricarboxylate transporter substrate binding protein n=1 Tax=Vineibacter terrae TaxID=2586908 RepID=UPI002E326AF1|nr:tripartite tricarboxylate transporter substrate binding protein [Vineibacter terrae]HEX2887249.1 tripartite tricarboxylate transporter substrate binding protein [Vineibacter terrae]
MRRTVKGSIRFILAAAVAAVGAAAAAITPASAQIQFVSPYPPGGITDIVSRTLADGLGKSLNQTVIVLNKPGANGMIGSDYAAKSAPDGKTLLLVAAAHAINPSMHAKMAYDPFKDLVGVSLIGKTGPVIFASAKLPITTMQELVAYAKKHPGKVTYGSSGVGSGAHLVGELLCQTLGIDMTHVVYKGSEAALIDLFNGELTLFINTMQTWAQHGSSGKLRALAIGSAARWPRAPDVPTLDETVAPGMVADSFLGVLAPAGTPAAAVDTYSKTIAAIIARKDVTERLMDYGIEPTGSTPAAFDAFIASEAKKWGDLIRARNIKPDR